MLGAKANTEERTVNPSSDKRKESKAASAETGNLECQDYVSGLSDDLQQIDDARKAAVISRELKRLNIDIAALQETRFPSNGRLKEEDYTFFWQGKAPEEHRVHGVGFAVRNSLLSSVMPPSEGTARILSLRLTTTSGPVNIMCA